MAASMKDALKGVDEEEYVNQAKLLKEFINISNIDKGWVFSSESDSNISQAMFSISQPNLLANKKRVMLLSSNISRISSQSVSFQWSAFPVEMIGVSAVVPSPSGSKLLVVRNKDDGSPTQLEIWDHVMLQKEISIPQTVHGPLYTDQWFEGISWNKEENLIAYVAEEPSHKPVFDDSGFRRHGIADNDSRSWKGKGDWEEHWGETYSGKTKPSLYVVNTESGEVRAVDGIAKSLSVGQVVWAPSTEGCSKFLVFVAWESEHAKNRSSRKLGIIYCYNRPCSLYMARSPFQESISREQLSTNDDKHPDPAINLTPSMHSAFFPRFCTDGRFLLFLSAQTTVDSGAHNATNSLHRIDWLPDEPGSSVSIFDVVPVVQCPEDDCFPGLYCPSIIRNPWLSDGTTMILCSYWGSTQVILSINILSGKVSRVTPDNGYSWNLLALDRDNIVSVCSSPVDPPKIKYGYSVCLEQKHDGHAWHWLDIKCASLGSSEKVKGLLSSMDFRILKIPVRNEGATEGAKTIESIFVSSDSQEKDLQEDNKQTHPCNPLIVIIHGGPHSVSLTSYSKSLAFLASLGYNLLMVNYRGSLGFGEEPLQSVLGNIGNQDVNDVLAALDHVIQMGLADKSRVAVLGGSHGGFLATHLIGQAPDRFVAAAARNPVCNLALMVGTTDIPDWCYVEAYGTEGKSFITEAPTVQHLDHFLSKSPIAHLEKVKAPILFLLGAQDLRVPASNGLQYARALKEKGSEVKIIVFPEDNHGIERPQSDFESFLNIGVWFRKYCR